MINKRKSFSEIAQVEKKINLFFSKRSLLLALAFAPLMLTSLSGCISDASQIEKEVRPKGGVEVYANVLPSRGYSSASPNVRSVVDPASTDDATLAAEEAEQYVGRMRIIFWTSNSSDKTIAYTRSFRVKTAAHDPGEGDIDETITGGKVANVKVKATLPAGTYYLQVIANEPSGVMNPLDTYQNSIYSLTDLQNMITTKSLGLPMSSDLKQVTILAGQDIDEEIDIHRDFSRLELNLTNKDKDNGDAVFLNARYAKITKVDLVKVNQAYGFYHIPDPSVYLSGTSASKEISHTEGAAFDESNLIDLYMTPRQGVTSATDATAFKIYVQYLGKPYVYTIPIYDQPKATSPKDYNIKKNTIYRINAILKGANILVQEPVLVEGWHIIAPANITVDSDNMDNE